MADDAYAFIQGLAFDKIANGDNDRMVPSVLTEDLHRRIKGSELVIY